MRRNRRSDAYRIPECPRASLTEVTRKNIAVPVDLHPRDGRAHAQKVVARDDAPMHRGILAVDRRPGRAIEHERRSAKRSRFYRRVEPTHRIKIRMLRPEAAIDPHGRGS